MTKFFYEHEIIDHIISEELIMSNEEKEGMIDMSEKELDKLCEKYWGNVAITYNLWNMRNQICFEYKTEKMLVHPKDKSIEIIKKVYNKLNEV
jgi:hypothetical protein